MIHVSTAAARAPTASLRDWRKRHPCPHRSDEQCGQDKGDRGKRVRARDCPATEPVRNGAPGRPPCACCWPWSRADSRSAVWILRKDLRIKPASNKPATGAGQLGVTAGAHDHSRALVRACSAGLTAGSQAENAGSIPVIRSNAKALLRRCPHRSWAFVVHGQHGSQQQHSNYEATSSPSDAGRRPRCSSTSADRRSAMSRSASLVARW
jgi:hypothetical protein